MLEDGVDADHRDMGGIEGLGNALRLRDAVRDAAGAKHLERMERDHPAPQIL